MVKDKKRAGRPRTGDSYKSIKLRSDLKDQIDLIAIQSRFSVQVVMDMLVEKGLKVWKEEEKEKIKKAA